MARRLLQGQAKLAVHAVITACAPVYQSGRLAARARANYTGGMGRRLTRLGEVTLAQWARLAAASLLVLVLAAAMVFRAQVLRSLLDPKQPFQTYQPPPAPDYGQASAWALRPPHGDGRGVDVFFVHPTTYSGGEEWNGPIDHPRSSRQLGEVMLPNYAGPFARVGRVFAPRYRQASLYAMLSLREDAAEARKFAYDDVLRAFRAWQARDNQGRPFIIAGVEQGGSIADRLLQDVIGPDPGMRKRLVAAYLIRTVTPAARPASALPACTSRRQAGCVVAFMPVRDGHSGESRRILQRALVWGPEGELQPLGGRAALCVNPLVGSATATPAPTRANLGAANATGLEWGLRPPVLAHEVSARCVGGLLWVSRPDSPTLKTQGGWADHLKAAGYNAFYADIEADAAARVAAAQRSRATG